MNSKKGFTLIEIIVVIVLMALFALLAVPFSSRIYREQLLQEQTVTLESNLKKVQSYAQNGKDNSSWGVAFNPSDVECENCYVVFRNSGEGGYGEREVEDRDFDEVFHVPEAVLIEGVSEIVFRRGSGEPEILED